MKRLVGRCDLEEGLLSVGLILIAAGVWLTYGLGPALTVSGGLLVTLGSVIAFWR